MKPLDLPSVEVLETYWVYDEHTGTLYSKRYSKRVGFKTTSGYLAVEYQRRQLLVHRVAWKMKYGAEPPEMLDHIDGDKHNNRIENLREASANTNQYNQTAHRDNALGIKGVCQTPKGTYRAYTKVDGRMVQAYFKTVTEAEVWVRNQREILHGNFVNHGVN